MRTLSAIASSWMAVLVVGIADTTEDTASTAATNTGLVMILSQLLPLRGGGVVG